MDSVMAFLHDKMDKMNRDRFKPAIPSSPIELSLESKLFENCENYKEWIFAVKSYNNMLKY